MANRYWVGGTASWDGTVGTKWAATSGGAGGVSVPTSADDVFFTNLSTGTCTIATGNTGAKSINCTGFTGTIAGTGAITVSGSVTLASGQGYTHSGTMTFNGSGTLTTAGKTFSAITVSGSGITLTLGDALNMSTRLLDLRQGTFATAGYALTLGTFRTDLSTSTKSIVLGSSTLTVSASINFSGANLTLDAGTSQINFSATSGTLNGGSNTLYNVSLTSTAAGSRTISGANTFNDLTLTASATGLSQLSFGADQTVNGTFTCAGASVIARGFVRSSVIGSTRTITAAAVSADDCDFRDITIAGAAAPISPTRAGDCGGNSGITFPAAKTVYRVGTSTSWIGSSSWSLTSGGTGSDNNFPLAQDTAVINNDTALTGNLGIDVVNISAVDSSTRTTAITFSLSQSAVGFYGSYILGSGVTLSGASIQTFSGRGTMVFTSAGNTVVFPLTVDTPDGTFQLGDALSSSTVITHTRGTFDANGYNVTCNAFTSSNTNVRTITMGSGLWTLSGAGTAWSVANPANLTLNKDTADVLLSNNTTTNRVFSGGGGSQSYNKITIGGVTSTSITVLQGGFSITELAATKTVAHTVQLSTDLGTIDTWSVTGSAGNVVTVNSNIAGTRRTFTLTNVTSGIDYLSVKDIGEISGSKFYVGANSTDGGNNSNVYFTTAPAASSLIYYGSTNVTAIYFGSAPVTAIYYGSTQVF